MTSNSLSIRCAKSLVESTCGSTLFAFRKTMCKNEVVLVGEIYSIQRDPSRGLAWHHAKNVINVFSYNSGNDSADCSCKFI
jgi:hypothetical protein